MVPTLLVFNDKRSTYLQLTLLWTLLDCTETNGYHPESHHHQSQLASQATSHHQCTMATQFPLLPRHTTLTNTDQLSIHAHLCQPTQNDDASSLRLSTLLWLLSYIGDVLPCCLCFVNTKIAVGSSYRDRSWLLPGLARGTVHYCQCTSLLPHSHLSSPQFLVKGNMTSIQGFHHHKLLPWSNTRVASCR